MQTCNYNIKLIKKIDNNIQAVLNKSNYILGEEVQILEQELQNLRVQNMLLPAHQELMHCYLL